MLIAQASMRMEGHILQPRDFTLNLAVAIGGVIIGAILTYLLLLRKKKSLLVRTKTIEYAIPSEHHKFGPLHVTYDNNQYDKLSYCEFIMRNESEDKEIDAPIIISLGENSKIIASHVRCSDGVENPPPPSTDNLSQGSYLYKIAGLKPGDFLELRLLASNASKYEVKFRGDPKVRVAYSEEQLRDPLISAVRNLISLYAFRHIVILIPIFGELISSLMILLYVPIAISIASSLRNLLSKRSQMQSIGNINVDGGSEVQVHQHSA